MTGNNQPGRMVVGQTFTIGRPSQLLDICFYWIICIAQVEYAGVSFFIRRVFKSMSYTWKWSPESGALGETFVV